MIVRLPQGTSPIQPLKQDRKANPTPPRLLAGEDGVAFLLAIVVLTIMAVMASAGFYAVRQEGRMGSASERVVQAKYLAEDAANGILANWRGDLYGILPIGGSTTLFDSTSVGTTRVNIGRKGAGLYFVTAEARVGLDGNGGAASQRRMGMMARLRQTQFYFPSALTTSGNVTVSGTARIVGADQIPLGWGGVCSALGLSRPAITNLSTATVATADAAVVTGTPPVSANDPVASAATTVFSELTWTQLVALADRTIPGGNIGSVGPVSTSGTCDTAAPFNWGNPADPAAPCGAFFPIIHVAGDARLTGGGVGQGILLIDGNLDVIQPFGFFGIVIVRGDIDTSANVAQFYGHVRAHHVDLTSVSPTIPSLIGLSSCAVHRAVVNHPMLTRAVPIGERSWIDLTALDG